MGIALGIHVLSVVLWVGGMFFAHMILRPAAVTQLEPPLRLNLWRHVFNRFFPLVWVLIVLVPLTGIALVMPYGGFAGAPKYIHIMTTLGVVMILIFLHVFFAPFRRLKQRLDEGDVPGAAKHLAQIRFLVGLNTVIGFVTILVATTGKYFLA